MTRGRRPLIAGNWKMNGLKADGEVRAADLASRMKNAGTTAFDIAVCPPFTLITAIGAMLDSSGVGLGGQDCHAAESGAHTADISAAMLADLGCGYVIVGHSERRIHHAETDALIKSKAEAALAAGLIVIVCVGETDSERDAGRTIDVVNGQLSGSLPNGTNATNTVVAYEPVWAIGTGRVATPQQAQDVHAAIRTQAFKLIGDAAATQLRILYGGSMKPGNAAELLALPDVDGGLIGGASLVAADFWAIGESCA